MLQAVSFWLFFCFSVIMLLLVVKPIITPFAVAFIVSYLLAPLVDFAEKKMKAPRWLCVFLVVLLFFSLIIFALINFFPFVISQVILLLENIPIYKKYLSESVNLFLKNYLPNLHQDTFTYLSSSLQSISAQIFTYIASLFNGIWGYTVATLSGFISIFLLPIILYYFLYDWHNIFPKFLELIPIKYQKTIKEVFCEINVLMAGYLRGQLYVCTGVAIYYIIGLWYLGVNFPILLGILSGCFIVIPFLGIVCSFSLTMLIAYFSLGMQIKLFYVSMLYLCAQIIEGNFISPRVIGDNIGVHPLVIIFSVLLISNFAGFVGIILAMPIAGICKVFIKLLIRIYHSSSLYKSKS